MNTYQDSRIGFGVITNKIDSLSPYLDFIKNAENYNYKISSFIITYSDTFNEKIVRKLKKYTDIQLVRTENDLTLKEQLSDIGLSEQAITTFLSHPEGIIAYGKRRNIVLIKALLDPRLDYLFFVDTDVKPRILNTRGSLNEVDFIGRHLKHLIKDNVIITTSDYSGYYIIPPLDFAGLKDLLIGLQKENAFNFLLNNQNTLIKTDVNNRYIKETDKILGGNHALKLSEYLSLSPYFSTRYKFAGQFWLGRGEDTLLGKRIPLTGNKIIDIDTRIFHNTFDNYPLKPDIHNPGIQHRFYTACLGWLGRNPFLNWYLKEIGQLKTKELELRKKRQKEHLNIGSRKIAAYLKNDKFKKLPEAFDSAYHQLEQMKQGFYQTIEAWEELLGKLKQRRGKDEDTSGQPLPFRRLG